MDSLLIISVFVAIFILGLLVIYFLSKNFKKGKFNKSSHEDNISFVTDFGLFRIDKGNEILVHKNIKAEVCKINFSDIKGIHYEVNNSNTVLIGYTIGSLLDEYEWHILSLLTNNGERIPIYVVGKYKPKSIFMFYINFQLQILAFFGLLKNISEHSQKHLDTIIAEFKRAGKDIKIC